MLDCVFVFLYPRGGGLFVFVHIVMQCVFGQIPVVWDYKNGSYLLSVNLYDGKREEEVWVDNSVRQMFCFSLIGDCFFYSFFLTN